MSEQPSNFSCDNEKVDGQDMVRITLGSETILVSTDEAMRLSEVLKMTAEMPMSLNHIDAAFSGWGCDGGTC